MRRLPPPLSVTLPPPSSTTSRRVLRTLAVARSVIVTGFGPQSKRTWPPARTAATTAAEVQLRAVPSPTTRAEAVPPPRASVPTHAAAAPPSARIARHRRSVM